MAQGNQLRYFGIDRPVLPYRSFTSPIDEAPHFIPGSINALTSAKGELSKRPGFTASIESALSAVPGLHVRLYGWRRWKGSTTNPGAFYVMLCTIEAGVAKVWKYKIGDPSFTLLWRETDAVGGVATGVPFDFVDSNNFVYFGNASIRDNMRKYDGTDCILWGLDAPPAPPSFLFVGSVLPAGLSLDGTTGVLSGTPTSAGTSTLTVTSTDAASATSSQTFNLSIQPAGFQWTTTAGSLIPGVVGTTYLSILQAQSGAPAYTFSLYSGTLPTGVGLSSGGTITGTPTVAGNFSFAVQVADGLGVTIVRAFSIYIGNGALSISPTSFPDANVGIAYSQQLTASGGTGPYTFAVVGGGMPAGLSLGTTGASAGILAGTPTSGGNYILVIRVTDSTPIARQFVVPINIISSSLEIVTKSIPAAQVGVPYSVTINSSGGAAPYAYTYTAGALTAQTGYVGGYTYVSKYGHESAMSPLSDNTGLFTDQNLGWDFISSLDPQVNGINYYRSTDGGVQDPSVMRLVASLGNGIISYLDSTADVFLGSQTGPALYVNDPPQPLRGFKWSNGRGWGFKDDATWFTGNEEVTNGIPFECMSDAKNGNFYRWPSEVFGIEVTDNGVDIGLSEEFWQVSGDTLSTFRKQRLLKGGGILSPTCITTVGNTVFWIDTGKQVWSSDKGEIGMSIRPDLASTVPEQTFIAYHKFQNRNWLCILDGANDRMLFYDMDLEMWQVPWSTAATTMASMQTATGAIDLLVSFPSGHVLKLTTGQYLDDGAAYGDQLRSSLFPLVPGARSTSRNTELLQQIEQWEMETDKTGGQANIPDSFYMLTDDNPFVLTLDQWNALTDPQPLQFGKILDEQIALAATRWSPDSGDVMKARRAAFAAVWDASPDAWTVYSFDLAIRG